MDLNELETYRGWWRKQNSRIQGFNRSFLAVTPEGDTLEADFNFHDKLVRLSIEVANENGKNYAATIKNGSIIKEKDITSGRNYPIGKKIRPFRDIFSCIPDADLLDSLGGTYEISLTPLGKKVERRVGRGIYQEEESGFGRFNLPKSTKYDSIFGIQRETWFQRWQRKRWERRINREPLWTRFKRRFWAELHDFVLGAGMAWVVYNYYFDFVILGLALGAFGFITGGLDWAFRKRNPLLLKVLSFISLGSYFFYNGYTRF
ncbi:MAG: hypothetical protein O9346_13140 [Leptospiraceae bacterium]|jgi:hypothetical protein|nr:hypothetical protein [Leptospiraceae bacterium]MCZ8347356.1 hypothetical protein [Leptospiraceae bacterium]PJE03780.1 MAG: hypothetical protein CK427_04725 [Leptospira sp.]